MLRYCEAEQITFTRGRPHCKNDQSHVEQKNGAIVRQVIGYKRLQGEQTYQQLAQVYLALRLYVNGFQPSMKLQDISTDGRKPRRVYDAAKTPLQRLLLSQVLPASTELELQRAARMLDPLRLLHHLQDLQQALLCPQTSSSSEAFEKAPGAILPFRLERCVGRPSAVSLAQTEPEAAAHQMSSSCREESSSHAVLSAQLAEDDHTGSSQGMTEPGAECQPPSTNDGVSQSHHLPDEGQASRAPRRRSRPAIPLVERTVEQAIQDYLCEQKSRHLRPKPWSGINERWYSCRSIYSPSTSVPSLIRSPRRR